MRIDRGGVHQRPEAAWRRRDELHLPDQAFARADLSAGPFLLDQAPRRVGETLEDLVDHVLRGDRPVEIDEEFQHLLTIKEIFCPPNPKELLNTCFTFFFLASFGT